MLVAGTGLGIPYHSENKRALANAERECKGLKRSNQRAENKQKREEEKRKLAEEQRKQAEEQKIFWNKHLY